MYDFRMLNRRPLELPPLDCPVPLVGLQFKRYTNREARDQLRQMPPLLYNPYSGWYFALSNLGIGKMTNKQDVKTSQNAIIHLSAVANLDILVLYAVLGYSKPESPTRVNSLGRTVSANKHIKANHRFYVGAWIDEKPYSVRLLAREYSDGSVVLGEEANVYALTIKEMRGLNAGTSVLPASHGVTKALRINPLIKETATGNISASSSRCGPTPPTDAPLTWTKIRQIPQFTKVPLQCLIEENLKEDEEALYRERAAFDYSKTGTDRVETIFDRLRLTDKERQLLYAGQEITVHNLKIRTNKLDATLSFRNGELKLMPTETT